jgi:hypothetical protein
MSGVFGAKEHGRNRDASRHQEPQANTNPTRRDDFLILPHRASMAHAQLTRKRVNDRPVTWHIDHAWRPRRGDRVGVTTYAIGTNPTSGDVRSLVAIGGRADIGRTLHFGSD